VICLKDKKRERGRIQDRVGEEIYSKGIKENVVRAGSQRSIEGKNRWEREGGRVRIK
jgi:hypothetical protein